MKGDGRLLALAITLFLLCVSTAGCGKKGDPLPPQAKPLAVVASLVIDRSKEGVNLRWSLTNAGANISSFKLFRSQILADQDCPGCPRNYQLLETINIGDAGLQRQGKNEFLYSDRSAVDGRQYSYKVVGCDRTGRCGEPSPEAGTILPVP